MSKKPKKKQPAHLGHKKRNSSRTRRSLSKANARRLGYDCENIAAADKACGLSTNLAEYLAKHPKVRAAYDRGRLLKYIADLAPKALIYETARRLRELGFSEIDSAQSLRDFFDSDPEANELWETERVNGFIRNRENAIKSAASGNIKAIEFIDKWCVDRLREMGEPGVSFHRVTVSQMAELFATSRQTIHEWYRTKGLPQNTDGSFDLYRAIAWYGDYQLKKAVRGKESISPMNPQQAVKAKISELQYQQMLGEMVDRGSFIGFIAAIMQNLVNAFNSLPDLANRIYAQEREQIVERLEDFRDEVMAIIQKVPEDLKLSQEAEDKLIEFYESIKPQNTDERSKNKQ